jgi:hypothetical protein
MEFLEGEEEGGGLEFDINVLPYCGEFLRFCLKKQNGLCLIFGRFYLFIGSF